MNLISVFLLSCSIFLTYPKADLSDREVMLKSVQCRPHPRQVVFQEPEFTAFIHFGVNTFTGREWGTGFAEYCHVESRKKADRPLAGLLRHPHA